MIPRENDQRAVADGEMNTDQQQIQNPTLSAKGICSGNSEGFRKENSLELYLDTCKTHPSLKPKYIPACSVLVIQSLA